MFFEMQSRVSRLIIGMRVAKDGLQCLGSP